MFEPELFPLEQNPSEQLTSDTPSLSIVYQPITERFDVNSSPNKTVFSTFTLTY